MAALPPILCRTMDEVRAGVDETDRQLVALLARRFGYMEAAARIKERRGDVRDDARKAAVIEAMRADAQARGLPADALATLWDGLVEASIAYEEKAWDDLHDPPASSPRT